ncbi:hypothetical protein [Cryptosporangium phraense]|nr:hypothetical protein [Cryptosporangium phraense]
MLDLDRIDEVSLDAVPEAIAGELIDADVAVGDGMDWIAWSSFI